MGSLCYDIGSCPLVYERDSGAVFFMTIIPCLDTSTILLKLSFFTTSIATRTRHNHLLHSRPVSYPWCPQTIGVLHQHIHRALRTTPTHICLALSKVESLPGPKKKTGGISQIRQSEGEFRIVSPNESTVSMTHQVGETRMPD